VYESLALKIVGTAKVIRTCPGWYCPYNGQSSLDIFPWRTFRAPQHWQMHSRLLTEPLEVMLQSAADISDFLS